MPKQTKKQKKKKLNQKNNRLIKAPDKCWFCEHETTPDYKDVSVLKNCLTPRGKILPRMITGICARHQRMLAKSVKIARQMALVR
jgi:small subunit ribosomal protein S18